MIIILSVLFGFVGVVLGYKIQELSYKIMEYKKAKDSFKKNEGFLDSIWLQLILSLFNGGVWLLAVLRLESPFVALLIGIMVSFGLIIVFIDIKIRIIPNELVLALIIFGTIFQVVNYGPKSLVSALISMIVMMVIFTSVAGFVGFGKVGAGDVKLAGVMGLTLGYPLIITSVGIMAFVLLAFILIGLAFKKIYLSTMLPLAPFLISGFVFALVTLII